MDRSTWILLAGILIGGIAVWLILHALWHFGYFTLFSILKLLHAQQSPEQPAPRSLKNCENMILKQVLRDFPEFDLAMEKNRVRDFLLETYADRSDFRIYKVVLSDYRPESRQKKLFWEAAVSWQEPELLQKRLEICLQFQHLEGQEGPALTCPNCGAALGFDDLQCRYCGTRIPDSRQAQWAFTTVVER